MKYNTYEVSEHADGKFTGSVVEKDTASLPEGDVLIRVEYSSLNYKDALSASGNKGVTKNYPHTPGVDAAGTVAESSSAKFAEGALVLVTGHDMGMNTPGGFGQYIRVPAAWVAPCPEGLDLRRAMMLGTAGQTAAMCVERLMHHGIEAVEPGGAGESESGAPEADSSPVLVTGATGGVGILSVALLSHLGYEVIASTGKAEAAPLLKKLGASEVIDRSELSEANPRPLLKGRWAGAVDVVGGETLANVIKSLKYGGAVAACGLVQSPAFQTSVFPFILRGVSLLGVDSAEAPISAKGFYWQQLANEWRIPDEHLNALCKEITYKELPAALNELLKGGVTGRYVLNLSATSD